MMFYGELYLISKKPQNITDTYVDSRKKPEKQNALTMLVYWFLKDFPLPTEDFRNFLILNCSD